MTPAPKFCFHERPAVRNTVMANNLARSSVGPRDKEHSGIVCCAHNMCYNVHSQALVNTDCNIIVNACTDIEYTDGF